MNWTRVEESLPKDDLDVLVLVEGYGLPNAQVFDEKKEKWIFLGHFNRKYGWTVPFASKHAAVLAWMVKPIDLED